MLSFSGCVWSSLMKTSGSYQRRVSFFTSVHWKIALTLFFFAFTKAPQSTKNHPDTPQMTIRVDGEKVLFAMQLAHLPLSIVPCLPLNLAPDRPSSASGSARQRRGNGTATAKDQKKGETRGYCCAGREKEGQLLTRRVMASLQRPSQCELCLPRMMLPNRRPLREPSLP
jgi:hypothetical protein